MVLVLIICEDFQISPTFFRRFHFVFADDFSTKKLESKILRLGKLQLCSADFKKNQRFEQFALRHNVSKPINVKDMSQIWERLRKDETRKEPEWCPGYTDKLHRERHRASKQIKIS